MTTPADESFATNSGAEVAGPAVHARSGDGSRAHELNQFCEAVGLFMTNDPMALSGRSAYLGLQHALPLWGALLPRHRSSRWVRFK